MIDSKHKALLSCLGVGRDNARSADDVAKLLGTDKRHLRAMIHRARLDGEQVCGDRSGIYIAGCQAESDCTADRLRRMGKSSQAAADAMTGGHDG